VFESRKKFNFPDRPDDASFVIVVLDLSHDNEVFRIGAVVDRVKDVISINDQDIKPVPPMSKEFNTEFLEGIYKQGDTFIMLLKVEKVFTGDELDVIKETNVQEGILTT
jgi:purine-binding chemotaxis protein CheW